MSRIVEMPNIYDLHRRYMAGETASQLALEYGCHANTILGRFRRAGLPRLPTGGQQRDRIAIPGLDLLLARYLAGESENALAHEAGANRSTFRRRLLKADITPRGRSLAGHLKWDRMSALQREAQVRAAHAANVGRIPSWEERRHQAQTRQSRLLTISPVERTLATGLAAHGLIPIAQYALGIYNIDIALDASALAVEVFGGKWHAFGRHRSRFFERTIYILNSGWHLLVVWVDGKHYPLGAAAVEYIIALAKDISRNPATPRQYRVILGNGEPAPVLKTHLNRPADIERLHCRFRAPGHYDYIPG